MTQPAGTIDLGELPRDGRPVPDAPWPVLARLRRWHDRRRTGRLLGTATVTVLALLAVTGAAGPVRPAFARQLTIPAVVNYAYGEQRLYVIEAPGAGRTRLVAYRLADGAVDWQAPLPDREQFGLVLAGGVLVVSLDDPTPTTAALDAGTGQELWRRPEAQLLDGTAGGLLVLSDAWRSPSPGPGPGGRTAHRVTAVDPATGRAVWTTRVPDGSYTYDPRGPEHLLVQRRDGRFSSYDLRTGERLAGARMATTEFDEVHVAGSLVLLTDAGAGLTAYDLRTFAPLWTVEEPGRGYGWPVRCGELLCVVGEQPPRALDPATGELVWSADWLDGHDSAAIVVSDLPTDASLAGHLLVTERPSRRGWLVDAATGDPVLDLQDWYVPWGGPAPATGRPPWAVRYAAGSALVGELRADLSGVRLLGRVAAPPVSDCYATDGYVFCPAATNREPSHELTVWRHRRP